MQSNRIISRTNRTSGNRGLVPGICVLLTVVTWLVFGQTLTHDFVNYDDDVYIYGNPRVTSGLTLYGIKWALTHSHAHNWHPITTMSHMLDCQIFGLGAGGHHFTSILLHTVTVLLLFRLLREMTGTFWRSAFVAAVFAVHPLRVESVAWIAERKDVLSGIFFMLTLGAYLRYVGKLSLSSYLLVLLLFALGLMCKPMLVTLPFVLLLLDYWPLKRVIDFRTLGRFAFEKIPLWSLSLASCVATISAQREAVDAAAQLPLSWRINNALIGYVTYIAETLWPAKLAPFYPHPEGHLPVLEIILAAGFLIGISAIAVALRTQRPYILFGWLWYLGMLVPVIGVFQIGLQSHADRYTYLPQIGLLISFTWGIVDLWALWWRQRAVLAIVSASVVAILAGLAWRQTSYWRNSETLWRHALAVTADNDLARTSLGMFYDDSGRRDLAISQYESALKIRSAHPEALCNVTYLVHYDLGNALLHEGKFDDAIAHYKKAVQLRPNYASAYYNLGAALFYKGQLDDAIAQWQTTLAMQPDHAEAHAGLGTAFLRKGSLGEAINHYEKAIAAPVSSPFALNYLAWILSTCSDASFRNGPRGVELARQAVQFSGGKNPSFIRTLAAAYAETGRFNNAIETVSRALQLAKAQHNTALANELQQDVNLYRMRFPLRNHGLTNTHAVP